jgi:hypothetical protein
LETVVVPSFTVTAAGQKVTLDATGAAQASFTVTNTTAQALNGRLLVTPTDPAKPDWFSIAGDSVRSFAPNAAVQVVVQLNVPATTAPGSYSFRLDAVSEVDPDEDFTEGPSVAFDVAAAPPPPKKKFPWWILAIIGGVVLLIVIGVVIWLATKGDSKEPIPTTPTVAVPPVTRMRAPQAEEILAAAGFQARAVPVRVLLQSQVGVVQRQSPGPRTQQPAGTVVTISVGSFFTGRPVPPPPTRTIKG